ncbi:tRNA (adenosine(37)-N6)-threonylcarbamoyltransferase complex dimerization subunit type 1 TsaB [Actinomyces bouchesdurhonensis]|uniref:tRNA (adenosine(37)-N6)-threonylcarbamoyltransferase complex dimerization subunit type 1 TsaB n=2 Tax=Actinomyces bouchesdurhonensis TaxID=1852361 RepID=UPI0028EA3005|nr:tRNA (adenosine(37)-N6)-threonylcarbamoyltransferase complex dimerization subunit type 1 TsaB [Actinomyces bouchesdurhonensis]
MREIALDTQAATVVAIIDEGRVVGRARNDSGRRHAESITPLVRAALENAGLPPTLANAGIDRVLVGTGPAPFTGLRAGLVSARVLARVADVPAYGVCSLDVIARQGLDVLAPETRVYAIADARRRELYWGSYVAAGPNDVTLEGRLEVGDVSTLLSAMHSAPGLVVAGAPIPVHSSSALARADLGPQVELDPAVMSRLVATRLAHGQGDRLRTDPLYLRRPDIQGQPAARL